MTLWGSYQPFQMVSFQDRANRVSRAELLKTVIFSSTFSNITLVLLPEYQTLIFLLVLLCENKKLNNILHCDIPYHLLPQLTSTGLCYKKENTAFLLLYFYFMFQPRKSRFSRKYKIIQTLFSEMLMYYHKITGCYCICINR